jgi:hypothetical protein
MSVERELLRRVIDGGGSYNAMESLDKEIEEFLAQPEQDAITDKSTATAGAVMPNGVCVSNVYDAFEAGRASVMGEQEPVAWLYDWNTKEDERYGNAYYDRVSSDEGAIKRHACENIRPLYTSPQRLTLLSDEEVIARYKAIDVENALYVPTYYAGFRDAEKAYGIGVDDEE